MPMSHCMRYRWQEACMIQGREGGMPLETPFAGHTVTEIAVKLNVSIFISRSVCVLCAQVDTSYKSIFFAWLRLSALALSFSKVVVSGRKIQSGASRKAIGIVERPWASVSLFGDNGTQISLEERKCFLLRSDGKRNICWFSDDWRELSKDTAKKAFVFPCVHPCACVCSNDWRGLSKNTAKEVCVTIGKRRF